MNQIAMFGKLLLFSLLSRRVAGLLGQCVPSLEINPDCEATLENPCSAHVDGAPLGSLVSLRYRQPSSAIDDAVCKIGEDLSPCADYERKIYVRVTGNSLDGGVQVVLGEEGMEALCEVPCMSLTTSGFSGVCQSVEANMCEPTDQLCSAPLQGTIEILDATETTAQCEVDADYWTDAGSPCSVAEPCEVRAWELFAEEFVGKGDLLRITYSQTTVSSEDPESAFCDDGQCEEYCKTIYAENTGDLPSSTNTELSRTAIRALCAGPCLDGPRGSFTGICQEPPIFNNGTQCAYPITDEEICGIKLDGAVTYDIIRARRAGICSSETKDVFTDENGCGSLSFPCQMIMPQFPLGAYGLLSYTQESRDDERVCKEQEGALTDDLLGGDSCDAFESSGIYVWNVGMFPNVPGPLELSQHAVRALCKSPCLMGNGRFSGLCQEPGAGDDSCVYPGGEKDNICDVTLAGDVVIELTNGVNQPLPPSSSAQIRSEAILFVMGGLLMFKFW